MRWTWMQLTIPKWSLLINQEADRLNCVVHSESSLVELILIHFSYSGHFALFGNQVDAMELYVVPSTYCRWLKSIYVMHKIL